MRTKNLEKVQEIRPQNFFESKYSFGQKLDFYYHVGFTLMKLEESDIKDGNLRRPLKQTSIKYLALLFACLGTCETQ